MNTSCAGFMSNRGRQNVASYLALDLGIDWRMVSPHFFPCRRLPMCSLPRSRVFPHAWPDMIIVLGRCSMRGF